MNGRWLCAAALAFGFACATKHLGLVALGAATVVFQAVLARRVGGRRALATCVLLWLIALGTAAPWYARAFAGAGNPVFSELYTVFGARPAERWSMDSEEALARFKDHLDGRGPPSTS